MMSDSKPIPKHVGFFFLLILCMSNSFKLCCCIVVCPEIEKQALLKFKKSLQDPSGILSSWNISNEGNCCMWKGVVCSNLTGHVNQLHLQKPDHFQGLRGEVNPYLLNLKELRYLDLSLNDFGVGFPSFIGQTMNMEYLNLSSAGFHGKIPPNIGNLSNLHSLSLDGDFTYLDSMEWLSGLPRLEYLSMNGVNLSKETNWVQVINRLPSLVELHLRDCCLNSMPPFKHVNTTSLTILDLSKNKFDSFAMPRWIFQLHNLISLDLSFSGFEGPIPSISNITEPIKFIDLSDNMLNSSIPDWLYLCKNLEYVLMSANSIYNEISNDIGNLTFLRRLDLSQNELSGNLPRGIASLCNLKILNLDVNKLGGEVSDALGNMSDCFLESLTYLDLSDNQLSGNLTPQFGEFKSLQTLDLSRNSISGTIPNNIGKLSSLYNLGIGSNKISGNLPESLGQLYNLTSLNIEQNMLEGTITKTHFSNLSKLRYLYASGNHLSLKISSKWIPPFTLYTLALASWNLGTATIPLWIEKQNLLAELDLSNTGISGNIPTWFWEIPTLNLSHNNLHGQIPDMIGLEDDVHMLYLSGNRFSGLLPQVSSSVIKLDLSNNSFSGSMSHFLCDTTSLTYEMQILHLGGNQLTGELPDCFMKWPYLSVFNLAYNNLSGEIPNSIGFLAYMLSFSLHGNKFSGQIPFSMHNCTSLLKLDLGGNNFSGKIPGWMGTSLENLTFLILRSNKLSGEIPSDMCHLSRLQILDLSHNVFSGVIPKCVNNFTAMATKRSFNLVSLEELILVWNFIESASISTKRGVYEYSTILPLVTNIDLSHNSLSGEIPTELTRLVELRSLNISGNQLTGSIPDTMGDMNKLESLDLSRKSLSGEIPNSFTLMFSLSYLDLSFNNLTGKIPSSTQILSMDASSFVGNHLCGSPLPNSCSHDDPSEHVDDESGESKIEWLYIFLSLGYAVGLSACCTALVLKKSWRDAYFGLLECIWENLYLYFCIKWTLLATSLASFS